MTSCEKSTPVNCNTKKVKLFLVGANGKMGKSIQALAAKEYPLFEIISMNLKHLSSSHLPDIIIDFSSPQGTLDAIACAEKFKKPLVSGTTGLSQNHFQQMQKASNQIAILHSPNFSLQISLLLSLLEKMKTLPAISIEIREIHHLEKKDSPSGTALRLQKVLPNAPIFSERKEKVVGEHEVIFHFPYEQLHIKHTAHSRLAFAQGALTAATLLLKKPPGLYSLQDFMEFA